jgi:hypothetical protein
MGVVVGPVLQRPGGYAFDTWTPEDGLSLGCVYPRIEDANQAAIDRAMTECQLIDGTASLDGACLCGTTEQFVTELFERGTKLNGRVLDALCSFHFV